MSGPQQRYDDALVAARKGLPGTKVRDLSDPTWDYLREFDFVTEYDRSLCAPGLPPIARSKGMWNPRVHGSDPSEQVGATAKEHAQLLADVYAGKYRP